MGGKEGGGGGIEGGRLVGFEGCDDAGVEAVGLCEMFWDLTVEEAGGGDGLEEYKPHDFAQVAAGAEVFQGLEVREAVGCVEVFVPAGDGEDVLAEHTKFGVDEDVLS